jgi:hypothetical protein
VGAYLRSCGERCGGCFRLIATLLDLHGEWTGIKEGFKLCCCLLEVNLYGFFICKTWLIGSFRTLLLCIL